MWKYSSGKTMVYYRGLFFDPAQLLAVSQESSVLIRVTFQCGHQETVAGELQEFIEALRVGHD